MHIKKERTHHYGTSNIDFRTKRDDNGIKTYQPWLMGRHVGTMGLSDFHLTLNEKKEKFMSTRKLSTHKDIVKEIPNPKFHKTANFYVKNNVFMNQKTFFDDEKVGQLDESFKGKEKFTGESMMISVNTKLKHKDKNLSTGDKIRKMAIQENLSKGKSLINKKAEQETQLVKVSAKETLEGKVDLNKIQEIKFAIRRRYANRKNLRKIFKTWDSSSNGVVNLFDAHKMINKLAIPINFNETRVLIASATENDYLTVEDFTQMVHSEAQAINVDLAKLKCKLILYTILMKIQ